MAINITFDLLVVWNIICVFQSFLLGWRWTSTNQQDPMNINHIFVQLKTTSCPSWPKPNFCMAEIKWSQSEEDLTLRLPVVPWPAAMRWIHFPSKLYHCSMITKLTKFLFLSWCFIWQLHYITLDGGAFLSYFSVMASYKAPTVGWLVCSVSCWMPVQSDTVAAA